MRDLFWDLYAQKYQMLFSTKEENLGASKQLVDVVHNYLLIPYTGVLTCSFCVIRVYVKDLFT